MADPVLTLVDLSRIQDYVFASNRLRDAVGGAAMVSQLMSPAQLQACGINVSEVVIRHGGNLLFESPTIDEARSRVTKWSMNLNAKATPLRAAVAHQPIGSDWAVAHSALRARVAELKRAGLAPTGFGGLAVTERCASTGMPATGLRRLGPNDPWVPVSSMLANRKSGTAASDMARDGFEEPTELDELGRSFGEASLLGIVHVDLNQVGATIAAIEGRQGLLAFSEAMERVVGRVRNDLLLRTADAVDVGARGGPQVRLSSDTVVPLQRRGDDGNVVLPLRTVLVGGDDLTFVCDGRLALWMAELTLNSFRDHLSVDETLGGHPIGAAAGVAITRVHSPFVAGYRLAAQLCQLVKRKLALESASHHFGLDWEYSPQGQGAGPREGGGRPYDVFAGAGRWAWLTREALSSKDGMLRSDLWQSRRSDRHLLLRSAEGGKDAVAAAVETVGETPPWLADGQQTVLDPLVIRDLADLLDLWHEPAVVEDAP